MGFEQWWVRVPHGFPAFVGMTRAALPDTSRSGAFQALQRRLCCRSQLRQIAGCDLPDGRIDLVVERCRTLSLPPMAVRASSSAWVPALPQPHYAFEAPLDGVPGAAVHVECGTIHAFQIALDQPDIVENVLEVGLLGG